MLATRMGDFVLYLCKKPSGGPGPFIEGSNNTFTNNKPQVRVGDKSVPGMSLMGSTRRFTNNKSTTRITDPVLCGKTIESSLDTFIY